MLCAKWMPYRLNFKFEARTSRASMTYKDTYFIKVWHSNAPEVYGLGECALFKGLSKEDNSEYENKLDELCSNPEQNKPANSSIRFGFETALADLQNGGLGIISPNCDWIAGNVGIPINGLVWMGDKELMLQRIQQKLEEGFRCLKLKIGGINFDDEVELIRYIRRRFSVDELELRLDANGAFTPDNALSRLRTLYKFGIHSLEQPIKAGQLNAMAAVCFHSPIPIALDEELIGDTSIVSKGEMLEYVRPAYIILKPALCGGLSGADDWISAAEKLNIGWWATSALESNIGLNAIAQWVSSKHPFVPQGLGTGELYHNNIPSPVVRQGSKLYFDTSKPRADIDFEDYIS
jgi:o-succinylbenzoate synthase